MSTLPNPASAAPAAANVAIQFYERSTGVGLLRRVLVSAQALWPTLATRMAKQLFLTPLPPKWLHRGVAWGANWRVEHWPFERKSITVYRYQSAAVCEADAASGAVRPHVLVLHGWGGSAAQMQPIANAIANAGLIPLLIEAPAHGRSRGTSATLPQFARTLEYVSARLVAEGVPVLAVVAHSMGGSASAFAVARGLPVRGLVLLSAPDAPRDYTRMFAQVFGLSERTRLAMQRRIEAQEGILIQQFDAAQTAPRVSVPTLVVHDTHDTANAFASAERFMSLLPRAELLRTEGLGHRKILRDANVQSRVTDFLMRLLP